MNDQAPAGLENVSGALEFVKSQIDDIEGVTICPPGARIPGALISGDFTMMINLVNGDSLLFTRAVAETLLNEGIFYRLRIPIEFMTAC